MATTVDGWVEGVDGDFRLHNAVLEAMPSGTRVTHARRFGDSAWTKTAKIETITPEGTPKTYFLKVAAGPSARAMCEGEFVSAKLIREAVPNMVPEPYGWGSYFDDSANASSTEPEADSFQSDESESDSESEPGSDWTSIASSDDASEADNPGGTGGADEDQDERDTKTYFYLGEFKHMDFDELPDPDKLLGMLAKMHTEGTSPNGMFGFPVATACGRMQRTVTWEKSWAKSFAYQLKNVMQYDMEKHGPWPEFEAVCDEIINVVVPKLLNPLQEDGRELRPALVHGDFWEKNIALDHDTKEIVVFDPGCVYAHNEMEFGTWRSQWATHFVTKPEYKAAYDKLIQPSEPKEQYNDRLRLYIVRSHLNGSAGDFGTELRQLAYNDMLFLCEKYGELPGQDRYDPQKDLQVTGAYKAFDPTIER